MTWYYWVAYGLMLGAFVVNMWATDQARRARQAYETLAAETDAILKSTKVLADLYRDRLEAALKDVRIVLTDHRKEQDDPSDHLD